MPHTNAGVRMKVIATFTCGSKTTCQTKVDTVVVTVAPSDLREVVKKLSGHSCFYQSRPVGYRDMVVVDGELVRCELLPESADEDRVPVTVAQFRKLWASTHRSHIEEEAEDGASRPNRAANAVRPRRRSRQGQRGTKMMYVIATFTKGRRSETKANTVVVKVDKRDVDEVVTKLSAHSCYYQPCPAGYQDLIVVDGELLRCELLPASKTDKVGPFTVEEFGELWEEQRARHLWVDRDLRQRKQMRKRAALNRMPSGESKARNRSAGQPGSQRPKTSSRTSRKVRK